jgi:class 3 adenylate cyclase
MDKTYSQLTTRYFACAFILITSLFLTFKVYSQSNLDSLFAVWQNESLEDTIRLKALDDYGWEGFVYSNSDSAISIAKVMYEFAKQADIKKYLAVAKNMEGVAYWSRGDYADALKNYRESLAINQQINNKKGIASANNNIGAIYHNQGNYVKALQYFKISSKLYHELDNKHGVALSYSNISNIYREQGNRKSALEYSVKSYEIQKEINDKYDMSISLLNIGSDYASKGDIDTALNFYNEAIKLREEINDKRGLVTALEMAGYLYVLRDDFKKAEELSRKSLEIAQEIKDKRGTAIAYLGIGKIKLAQKKYGEANNYLLKALALFEELSLLPQIKKTSDQLYDSYKALNQGEKALYYLELSKTISDSLNIVETSQKLQQLEFEKQVLADSIAVAEEERKMQLVHQKEIEDKEKTRNIILFITGLILLLSAGLYSRLRYVRKSKAVIEMEKARSENLLLNILPAEIAEELKIKGKADARDFDLVSILFTDFIGFTETSEKLTASELVEEINACFQAFDHIMEKYKIEKVKTIGDAYMAAGGLPVPTDGSVRNTVLAALEMQEFIIKRKAEKLLSDKAAFDMRVGIHTGPVVAGIVGVKKFQYDIWGDTVNTASRIESNGQAGKVNISKATYDLLKNDSVFTFEYRGKIEAKGKGEIEMWFVSMKE